MHKYFHYYKPLQGILQGMLVRREQIKHNLYLTKGLIVSE